MIDVFDIFAFVVFGVLLVVGVVVVVALGSLPGSLARQWGHPQAAAVNVASWLGLATLGLLWPLALIWAFFVPRPTPPAEPAKEQSSRTDSDGQLEQMQARVASLEAALRELRASREVPS